MSHELGDGFRMGIAKILVIKVFREDSRLLNLAKCHSPLLLGLLGFNSVKFSWPRRLNLFLFLQENEL